jgi:hypothetical protein
MTSILSFVTSDKNRVLAWYLEDSSAYDCSHWFLGTLIILSSPISNMCHLSTSNSSATVFNGIISSLLDPPFGDHTMRFHHERLSYFVLESDLFVSFELLNLDMQYFRASWRQMYSVLTQSHRYKVTKTKSQYLHSKVQKNFHPLTEYLS